MPVEKAVPTKCYHVSQTEDKTKWKVTLAGGSKLDSGKAKIIKSFATQKEAIDYAHSLGDGEGTVYVHRVGGGIRKE